MAPKRFIPLVIVILFSVYLHLSATSFALNSSPREINKTELFASKIEEKVLDLSDAG